MNSNLPEVRRTSIGVTGEVAAPLDVGASLQVPRGDGIASNGAHNGGIRELGLGGNDAVRDVVVDGLRGG